VTANDGGLGILKVTRWWIRTNRTATRICKKLSVPFVNEHFYRDGAGFQNKREALIALLAPHAAQVVRKTKMQQRSFGWCIQRDELFDWGMCVSAIAQKCHKSLDGDLCESRMQNIF
jgi:hypothetical protein